MMIHSFIRSQHGRNEKDDVAVNDDDDGSNESGIGCFFFGLP